MIPATFIDSSDWGIPEGLMLADENSIDILLGTDVLVLSAVVVVGM